MQNGALTARGLGRPPRSPAPRAGRHRRPHDVVGDDDGRRALLLLIVSTADGGDVDYWTTWHIDQEPSRSFRGSAGSGYLSAVLACLQALVKILVFVQYHIWGESMTHLRDMLLWIRHHVSIKKIIFKKNIFFQKNNNAQALHTSKKQIHI
jgi:hypothetical protein